MRRLAWSLVVLSATCLLLDTVFVAAHLSLLSARAWADLGWPLIPLTTLGCAGMGALVVSRQPRHPIGRLLLLASVPSLSLPAESYSLWVLEGRGPGPDTAGHVAAWVSTLLSAPLGITALVLLYLLAPDGRLRSRTWRWAAGASLLGLALYVAGVLLLPPTRHTVTEPSGSLAVGRAHRHRLPRDHRLAPGGRDQPRPAGARRPGGAAPAAALGRGLGSPDRPGARRHDRRRERGQPGSTARVGRLVRRLPDDAPVHGRRGAAAPDARDRRARQPRAGRRSWRRRRWSRPTCWPSSRWVRCWPTARGCGRRC